MGDYTPTKEQFKAYRWCVNNGIQVAPFARNEASWWIEIKIKNNKTHRSPEFYHKDKIWEKIYEFNEYYYDKRQDREDR
jgi:hypothetical protein